MRNEPITLQLVKDPRTGVYMPLVPQRREHNASSYARPAEVRFTREELEAAERLDTGYYTKGGLRHIRFHRAEVRNGKKIVYYHLDFIDPETGIRWWKVMRFRFKAGVLKEDEQYEWRRG
jgi:hypothetical protein